MTILEPSIDKVVTIDRNSVTRRPASLGVETVN